EIEYVPSVSQCGSGNPVALQGSAVLSVTIQGAAQHTDAGQQTFAQQTVDGPGNTILEAKQHCDFEALLGWAMGLKGEQNFKVTTLQDPPRLVIDVKQ
ncbi:MAG: AMIN-like domain-containing (lipo)protein, partial [Tepidiformaceae bacterium]